MGGLFDEWMHGCVDGRSEFLNSRANECLGRKIGAIDQVSFDLIGFRVNLISS